MNVKTTIVLALLLIVGVGAYLMFQPKKVVVETASTTPDEGEKKSKPLYELGTLVKFEVTKPGKETLVFEKPLKEGKKDEYEDWKLSAPLKAKVANWEVNSFADKFKSPKFKEKFTPGQAGYPSVEKISLDKPKTIVTVTDAKGVIRKIEIGDKVFGGTDTYIRIAGEPVAYVAELDIREDLKKDVKKLRSKDLFDFDKAKIVQADIVHEGKTYTLIKGEGDSWVLDKPVKAPADKAKIDAFLNDVRALRADDFIEDVPKNLRTYGLDKDQFKTSVTVTVEEKIQEKKDESAQSQPTSTQASEPKFTIKRSTYGVVIGAASELKGDKFFAKLSDQPWVISVTKADAEKILPKLDQWRDPKVTHARILDAHKIELTVGEGRLVLEKEGLEWKMTSPMAAKAEQSAVNDLLNALNDLKATDWVDQPKDKKEYGLDKPGAEIVLGIKGSAQAERILVGGNTESGLLAYVHQAASPSIAVVKLDAAQKLKVNPLSYRDRTVFKFDRPQADRVELTRGTAKTVLTKQGGSWKLTAPIAADADTDAVNDLMGDLSALKASQIVGEGDLGKFGLDKPELTVSVTVQPPPPATASAPASSQAASKPATKPAEPKQYVLLVNRKDDKVYAVVAGGKVVYELGKNVYTNLSNEVHERKPLKFETSQAVGVEVVGGDVEKPLKFGKQNDKWSYLPDLHLAVDEQKIKDLITAVHDLKVERFDSYAASDYKAAGLEAPVLTVTVRLEGNKSVVMRIGAADKDGKRKAALEAEPGKIKVFVITKADVEKFAKKVSDFAKA